MKAAKDYINLLPPEEKKASRAFSAWSFAIAAFVLVWIALFGTEVARRASLKARYDAVSAQHLLLQQQLVALKKELGIEMPPGMNPEKASLIQNLLGERVLWSEVFKQFSQIVPRGVWFDSLEGNATDKASVKIRGGAFSYALVSQFMRGMEKSAYFDKPDLLFAQKSVLQGREVVGFEIVCNIKKGQGARP